MDAKRGVLQRGKHTSKVDRWQNDEVYRASQLVHGWTDEWVKYLDNISKIDISHDAPYRQRLRYESTVYIRGVDSNKQGPINELKAKEYLRFQCNCGQDKITLDPAVQQPLRMVEFQLEGVFLVIFILNVDKKAKRGGVVHLGTINGKDGTLKSGKTKNGGIGDNNDKARVTHRLVQGDRKGLSCCQVHLNPDSICDLAHFSDFFFLTVSCPDSGDCYERDGVCVQTTPHRTHIRALFLVAHARTQDVITR